MTVMNQLTASVKERRAYMKNRSIRHLLIEKGGDATLNWILGVVIGVAAVAIIIGLVNAAIPTLWTSVMDKITAVLN